MIQHKSSGARSISCWLRETITVSKEQPRALGNSPLLCLAFLAKCSELDTVRLYVGNNPSPMQGVGQGWQTWARQTFMDCSSHLP